MNDLVRCQWLSIPIGGYGEVAIEDRPYELLLTWLPWDTIQIPEITLRRPSKDGPIIYKLTKTKPSTPYRCSCPAAYYKGGKTCKHAAAVERLIEQLIQQWGKS